MFYLFIIKTYLFFVQMSLELFKINMPNISLIGYEVDQVTHTGPQTGSTTTKENLGGFSCYPDCEESDESVPIYNAYNHHYFGNMAAKKV